jgi:hypothetical protein
MFEWFAQESWAAAELTHEQPQQPGDAAAINCPYPRPR